MIHLRSQNFIDLFYWTWELEIHFHLCWSQDLTDKDGLWLSVTIHFLIYTNSLITEVISLNLFSLDTLLSIYAGNNGPVEAYGPCCTDWDSEISWWLFSIRIRCYCSYKMHFVRQALWDWYNWFSIQFLTTHSCPDVIARETKAFAFQAIGLLATRMPQLFRYVLFSDVCLLFTPPSPPDLPPLLSSLLQAFLLFVACKI